MKRWMLLTAALAVLTANSPVWATDEPEKISEMVVTATRSEISKDQIGGSDVTVITAEEIAAKKLPNVAEVLRGVPGLDIKTNGGLGAQSTASIRGGASKNTLILIDGVMLNDPSSPNRGADLAHITTDNIERIEVVRGPMSALYGTNAAAGVINIITKKGKAEPSVYGAVEGGSYNTWKINAGTTGVWKKFNFSLDAGQINTEGYSLADDDNDRIPHAGNTSEDDGYTNTTLSGKFGIEITPDFDINATVRRINSEVETDDFAWAGYAGDRFDTVAWVQTPTPNGPKEARIDTDQLFYKFDLHNYFFDQKLESKFYYQNSDQERKTYDNDGAFMNSYTGSSYEYGWQGGWDLNESFLLSGGASYFKESFETDTSAERNADTNSFWGQGQAFVGDGFVISGELRSDDHKEFGVHSTYRLAPAYTVNQTGTLAKASYGTGFRAPSLYELYADPNPLFLFIGGNPNLQPETSTGWDAGFEQPLFDRKVKFGATYFATTYEDRIIYAAVPGGNSYLNDTGKSKTSGVEAFVQWSPVTSIDLMLNYTYTAAYDAQDDRLIYTPLNKLYFNTVYRATKKMRFNLDAYWVDERDTASWDFDKNGNPAEKLDDYTLINIAGSYDFNKHLQFNGRIDNLFDEYYEESWSYATPGLSAYAGIKVTY